MKTEKTERKEWAEESNKFSVEKCKKILNQNGNNYSDEQVRKIRDYLYFIAEMEYHNFKKENSL